MKLAITGKGGTGKTTLSVLLARSFVKDGFRVIIVDADPAPSLAIALGIPNPEKITPISEMKTLIDERMGVSRDGPSSFFKLNPKVDDLPEKYWIEKDNIKLLVMGAIQEGGAGCACPQNAFLKALIMHLILARDEVVILDMEAGIEHIGRGTATAVDAFIIVLEANIPSIETGRRIAKLAGQIGIKRMFAVGNKIRDDRQEKFIQDNVDFAILAASLPYNEELLLSSMEGTGEAKGWEASSRLIDEVEGLKRALKSGLSR